MDRLVVLGLLVVLVGFALVSVGSVSMGTGSFGGVVFIGPFPIVFGSGPSGGELALISVVIGGVVVALTVIYGWRAAKTR